MFKLTGLVYLLTLFSQTLYRKGDHVDMIFTGRVKESYDYIVIGGGSAGAVVAARLSENENVTVLLLEAGGDENLVTDVPAAAPFLQRSSRDWQYDTEPLEAAGSGFRERRSRWPRGKVIGGSSVLNFMLYVRGNRRDFDAWADDGATGWSFSDLFPYFLKSEDMLDEDLAATAWHAKDGPLTVEMPRAPTTVGLKFVEAAEYVGYAGRDYNGETMSGFSLPQATKRNGTRCSTAKAFLIPANRRPNLSIVQLAKVEQIIFNENRTAVAVRYRNQWRRRVEVSANLEIILSAGAINSPQLLMLSGVGPADHLQKHGIPVIVDSPAVGANLQDHIAPEISFTLNGSYSLAPTLTSMFSPNNIRKYIFGNNGTLTSPAGIEGLAWVKTKYADQDEDFPDVEIVLACLGGFSLDRGTFGDLFNGDPDFYDQVYKPHSNEWSYGMWPQLLRPKSRGFVRLQSSNPHDKPLMDPRYFTHPDDIKVVVEGMKIGLAVAASPPLRALGSTPYNTSAPGCEQHLLYSDEYLACFARALPLTIWHPVGTCRMGAADDARSVVDTELRVIGVNGLRVVDASVMPLEISANTNAATIAIAERAADLIKGQVLDPYAPPEGSVKYATDYDFVDQVHEELVNGTMPTI